MSITDNPISIQLDRGESVTMEHDVAVKAVMHQNAELGINGVVVVDSDSEDDIYFEAVLKEGDQIEEAHDSTSGAIHIGGYVL